MTSSQKIGIFIVLISSIYSLVSIARYWLADVQYASGQKANQFFQKTQDIQYLNSSFQSFQAATRLNPTEPAIISEYAVSMAYIAVLLAPQDATSAGLLANTASSLSDKAIALSPHHPNYYKSAARTNILLARYGRAAEILTAATKISPTDPRIPYNLGLIYESLGKTDLARQAYQSALQLKPNFPDAKIALQKLNP